ncbi:MAG: COP23 domain-containing protein [Scytonema sp. PMC 1069.18]|nr:COP23 domain-containing protein [Scytonema sp. PMC 1069.18]MEC4885642.1 COP23 domain-containing protein [Scytonema sp. PMC 1070.18]
MNKRQFWTTAMWTTPLFTLGVVAPLAQPSTAPMANVACKTNASGVPTVIATFAEQETEKDFSVLNFLPEYFSPKDALENCQNTAKTLQTLYNTERANYLTNDTVNSQPVVCVVERRGIGCDRDSAQVLFTLDSTVNSSKALYDILGSDFKQAQPPDARTVSRIYSDIKPKRRSNRWWFFQ